MMTLLSYSIVIVSVLSWLYATVPDYLSHQWQCRTDAECWAEEYETFGTVNGTNPDWVN